MCWHSACMKGLSTGPHKRVGHLFEHFIVVGPSEGTTQAPYDSTSGNRSPRGPPVAPVPAPQSPVRNSLARFGDASPQVIITGDGPGPEVEIRQPTLSFKFPNVALPTDHVVHFCFPHGVEAQQIIASQSMSTENEILYDSLKRIERSNSSYVFILNTNDGVLFGVCVRRKELHDVRATPDTSCTGSYFLTFLLSPIYCRSRLPSCPSLRLRLQIREKVEATG